MTQEEQQSATPDSILAELMAGNRRYVANNTSGPDVQTRIAKTAGGQYPKAVILSCLDSRVPVELVFDQGIGDLFVGRVAGNVVNKDQLGSMEFATKLSGSKLVMVLGHSDCGAIKGACDGAELGNLTSLLGKIKPAIEAVDGFEQDQCSTGNREYVNAVVQQNVKLAIATIREQSPVLVELEQAGAIKIVGAYYDLRTGEVSLLD